MTIQFTFDETISTVRIWTICTICLIRGVGLFHILEVCLYNHICVSHLSHLFQILEVCLYNHICVSHFHILEVCLDNHIHLGVNRVPVWVLVLISVWLKTISQHFPFFRTSFFFALVANLPGFPGDIPKVLVNSREAPGRSRGTATRNLI